MKGSRWGRGYLCSKTSAGPDTAFYQEPVVSLRLSEPDRIPQAERTIT